MGLWLGMMEVAARSGYEDVNYFNKVFVEEEGCSPGAYRKRLKETADMLPDTEKKIWCEAWEKAEASSEEAEVSCQKLEADNQKLEVRNQESEIRS